jgi:glutathione S-transferase
MIETSTVYGMGFSVYVQVVRLTLAEKGIDHELIEVNPLS